MSKKFSLNAFYALFLFIAFFQTSVFAKDEWVRVRSKNFNLIGNASEKDIRKAATKLEQFRESFRLIFPSIRLSSPIPTNVVVFKSAASYKPFKPVRADGKADTGIAGYFQSGDDVNYITLSTEGEDADTYGTVFHEYIHFMVNTTFGKSDVPPWFNEGLAEYYQTFAIENDQNVKLGLIQDVHLNLLQQSKLIPLDTFFKISNYSLHQNGNHSRSIFYAQAWAMIHYLIQSEKAPGMGKFLMAVMDGIPPEKAFQEAFQMTYAQMEKELKQYVSKSQYRYQIYPLKEKMVFDQEMQITLMSESESNAYLGDLLYHTHRFDDAEPYLQKAAALAPDSSMINTTYGMVKFRQRKYAEAKSYLEKAISEDQKNHLAFYRYAELLSRESQDEFGLVANIPADKSTKIREMLKKAIAINPAFTDSYELFAFVSLVNDEKLDEAAAYLQTALKYQPGNERYLMRVAGIYLRQEKYADASALAEKLAKATDEPQIKSQAEELIGRIKQYQEMVAQQEASRKKYEAQVAENNQNAANRPSIRRRQPVEKELTPEEIAKIEAEAKMRSVNQAIRPVGAGEQRAIGHIQKIECKGKTVVFTVKSADEVFTLASNDFQSLALVAFVPEAENTPMKCGANFAKFNSILTYKPAAGAKTVNRGELIAVDFVPDDFRYVDINEPQPTGFTQTNIIKSDAEVPTEFKTNEPPPAVETYKQPTAEEMEAERRTFMLNQIKSRLRPLAAGEKRELGFLEKIECDNKGMYIVMKSTSGLLRLASKQGQQPMIMGFVPEINQIQFGCGLKAVEIPVVFTFKPNAEQKGKNQGDIIALEFVPKSFKLEE